MIDMHCHLIPGVDDGVKDINEAIEILRQSQEYGVSDVIITPHYRPTKEYVETTEGLLQKLQKLKDELKKQDIQVNLHLGREIDEAKDIKELLNNNEVCSLNGTNLLLIDFGVNKSKITDYIYETRLLGYKVVVAHVERYKYIESHQCFDNLKKEGAFLQVNASSIVSPRNIRMKKRIKYLFKNKLVDFVASDAHRNPDSYKIFDKAYKVISKKYGQEYANAVFYENAKELIKNN